jgi:hypothetical protein
LINLVNFAIWLPAVPALLGIMAMAGAQIEKLENSVCNEKTRTFL